MPRMTVGSSTRATIRSHRRSGCSAHVASEHPLEASRPTHRTSPGVGWSLVVVRLDFRRGRIDGSPSAALHGVACE